MNTGSKCVICYNDDSVKEWAITECNHVCCLKCALRYKFISNKSGCPICLKEIAETEMMFKVIKDPEIDRFRRTRDDYLWANCIVCVDEDLPVIEEILRRACQMCATEFYDTQSLLGHYVSKHKRRLCELCVEYRCEFPAEYVVYTEAGLMQHCNGTGPVDGHPKCAFCRERFYTQDVLVKHCRKVHELCYLCERLGKRHEYYKNYRELEKHLVKSHFTCTEKMCIEAKCYAFIDEVELAAHRASLHPAKKEEKVKLTYTQPMPGKGSAGLTKKSSKPSAPVVVAAVPDYLNREAIAKQRTLREKYTAWIEREYRSPAEIVRLTTEYNESKISLLQLVDEVRALIGNQSCFDFVMRVRTFLLPDRMKDIDGNLGKIKRNIEFPPFVASAPPPPATTSLSTASSSATNPAKGQKLGWGGAVTRNAWKAAVQGSHTLNNKSAPNKR
ncbi:E3 ubiquitin-protein ligase [Nematocida homosporus]|uniref:E3 ubiquitin-protein ligase n=1 Tax=Nematocida homosporus TaxID=1912981 RepID=UPI00221F1126|nr:E3 ubiquitin-protein ligase [Nematocida homosporus]KAI5187733.1 E3 ubiquitin-protein ligase [Nematocida homosporus]